MHFFESLFEALAASVIHRDKSERLRKWHTIGTSMQEFNVGIHLPKDRTENHFGECSLRNWPLCKQSRSSRQREPLHHTHEFLAIECEDRFLLMRHTDSRGTVPSRFANVWRHCGQDYKQTPCKADSSRCFCSSVYQAGE